MAAKRLRQHIGSRIAVIAIGLSAAFIAPSTVALSISDLACGAIICLAGDGGSACAPYIKKYKSISGATRAITKQLRKAFLNKCDKKKAPDTSAMEAKRAIEIEVLKKTYIKQIL